MDRPFGRQNSLVAFHPDMTGFIHFAHEMADSLVFRDIEIEISFHTTAVHVRRHRVPYAARFQFRHTHLQLAGRKDLIDDHLVDVAVVGHFQRAHSGNHSVSLRYFFIRIVAMCSRRVKIEFSRILGILAFKCHFTVTGTQIKSLLKIEFEDSIPSFYNTWSAHIDDPHFTTSQKERSFQRIDCFQNQYLASRHSATDDHTVVHRIDHIHFIRSKHLFYQEVTTDTFRIILLCIFRMRSITQFIICFHLLIVVLFFNF